MTLCPLWLNSDSDYAPAAMPLLLQLRVDAVLSKDTGLFGDPRRRVLRRDRRIGDRDVGERRRRLRGECHAAGGNENDQQEN